MCYEQRAQSGKNENVLSMEMCDVCTMKSEMHLVLCLVIGGSCVNIKTECVSEWPHGYQSCAGMFDF